MMIIFNIVIEWGVDNIITLFTKESAIYVNYLLPPPNVDNIITSYKL